MVAFKKVGRLVVALNQNFSLTTKKKSRCLQISDIGTQFELGRPALKNYTT